MEFYREFGEEECERVAVKAGTTLGYFKQIMYGHSTPSHRLAKRLEKESGRRMTRAKLRPDIWGQEQAA